MDEPHLVSVHKTGIAHHVAAIGKVDSQHRTTPILHRRRPMVVQLLVVVSTDVPTRENFFQVLRELGVNRHYVFKQAMFRALLDHHDLAFALDDGGFDLADFFVE